MKLYRLSVQLDASQLKPGDGSRVKVEEFDLPPKPVEDFDMRNAMAFPTIQPSSIKGNEVWGMSTEELLMDCKLGDLEVPFKKDGCLRVWLTDKEKLAVTKTFVEALLPLHSIGK